MMLTKISFMITSILAKVESGEENGLEKETPKKIQMILGKYREIKNVMWIR